MKYVECDVQDMLDKAFWTLPDFAEQMGASIKTASRWKKRLPRYAYSYLYLYIEHRDYNYEDQ